MSNDKEQEGSAGSAPEVVLEGFAGSAGSAGYVPLPGWYCPGCRAWNGLAKALEEKPFKPKPCRICYGPYVPESGLGRTELLRVVGLLANENAQLSAQLAKVTPSAEAIEVLRAARAWVRELDPDEDPSRNNSWLALLQVIRAVAALEALEALDRPGIETSTSGPC